jgi:hypothetical protein
MYYLIEGFGGGLGALCGGIILNLLQQGRYISSTNEYRFYFSFLFIFFMFLIYLSSRMERLGAYTIGDALAIIFSPRDLRAISLLNRLGKTVTPSEEKRMLRALGSSRSELSVNEILMRLKSPRFSVRIEALAALGNLPTNKREIKPLIEEVKNHVNTSAYLAAEIIGRKGYVEGISVLRKQLTSDDFFLNY